mmetsp:Transcript_746/g.2227  ORF Transcript_746/g.2227 Transcript_746/m.2227 type:complete len:247 (+) Transcript_746:130-870(+)
MHRFSRSTSFTSTDASKEDNKPTRQWLTHNLTLDVFKRIYHRWMVNSKEKSRRMRRARLKRSNSLQSSDVDPYAAYESKLTKSEVAQRQGSALVNKYLDDIMASMENTSRSKLPHFVMATFAKLPKQRSELDLDGAIGPVRSQSWIESLPPEAAMKTEVMRELLRYFRLKEYPKGAVIESVDFPIDNFYVILDGILVLQDERGNEVASRLYAGDCVGNEFLKSSIWNKDLKVERYDCFGEELNLRA